MASIAETLPVESSVKDYLALLKPSVTSLVVFSAIAGMVVAPGSINPLIAFTAIMCVAVGSGAAGAINMWYDRDIDSIMTRTQKRPIVTGKILPEEALSFGIILAFFSVFVMAVCVNYLSSLILLTAILFYVFVYTLWLKRRSVQNIVIGGAAGAFPPMIGWTAVTDSLSLQPMILFMLIFLWTPPHFWALALYRNEDYRKANIPMMPVILGDQFTKYNILLYTLLMVACSLLPYVIAISGFLYLAVALLLGGVFIYYATTLLLSATNRGSMRLFGYSIFYLFMLFTAMIIDHYLCR